MENKFNIDKITITHLREVMLKKHYSFYEKGNFNINIISVRSKNRVANSFDDWLFCVYKENNEWIKKTYRVTTDAGKYYLENPMNNKGTAILIPNQYKSAYKLAKHNGKYTALCQRKPVEVWRDNNKDNILNTETDKREWGLFGINIHRSNPYSESYVVEKWSAGCTVFKDVASYNEWIKICKLSSEKYGNSFTYTLLNETDLK